MTYWIDNEIIIQGSPQAVNSVLHKIAGPKDENGNRCPIDFNRIVPRPPEDDFATFKHLTDWLNDYWGTDRLPYNIELKKPKPGQAHILLETAMNPPFPILHALQEQYGSDVSFKLQYLNFQTGESGQIEGNSKGLETLIDRQRQKRREIEAHIEQLYAQSAHEMPLAL